MEVKTKFNINDLVNAMKDNEVVDLKIKKIIVNVNSTGISADYIISIDYITEHYDYNHHREEYIVPEYKCFKNKKELLESL
jgi:hypothetical protein